MILLLDVPKKALHLHHSKECAYNGSTSASLYRMCLQRLYIYIILKDMPTTALHLHHTKGCAYICITVKDVPTTALHLHHTKGCAYNGSTSTSL